MSGWVAMEAKERRGRVKVLHSQYHQRREGGDDQDGKSSETWSICARGIVWKWY